MPYAKLEDEGVITRLASAATGTLKANVVPPPARCVGEADVTVPCGFATHAAGHAHTSSAPSWPWFLLCTGRMPPAVRLVFEACVAVEEQARPSFLELVERTSPQVGPGRGMIDARVRRGALRCLRRRSRFFLNLCSIGRDCACPPTTTRTLTLGRRGTVPSACACGFLRARRAATGAPPRPRRSLAFRRG